MAEDLVIIDLDIFTELETLNQQDFPIEKVFAVAERPDQ